MHFTQAANATIAMTMSMNSPSSVKHQETDCAPEGATETNDDEEPGAEVFCFGVHDSYSIPGAGVIHPQHREIVVPVQAVRSMYTVCVFTRSWNFLP